MSNPLFLIIAAVCLDGCAGLVGGLFSDHWIRSKRIMLLGFAAGMMIAVSLLDILPEALASISVQKVGVLAGAGFCVFFFLEQLLGAHARQHSDSPHHGIGPALLFGDALHNISDGVTVAAAFLTDVKLGITTTIAVFLHELPQEAGDYAILLHVGYSKKKALILLLAVQFTALIGALATYWAYQAVSSIVPFLLAFAAGGFIYISAVDLIPELFKGKLSTVQRLQNVGYFLSGVVIIGAFQYLIH